MLNFLVTSKTRSELLRLLWKDKASGSVSELCEKGGLSFPSTRKELHAMRDWGLVCTETTARGLVYSANRAHRQAKLLAALVDTDQEAVELTEKRDTKLREQLKGLGAPLHGKRRSTANVESTLWGAVELARRDATVARVLPYCLWKQRDELSWQELVSKAPSPEEKHAMGFLLAITSEVSGDARFASVASLLRDGRMGRVRNFFLGHKSSRAEELAEMRSPALAKEWGFRLNMGVDSFHAPFEKAGCFS